MESIAGIKISSRCEMLYGWLKNSCHLENIQLIPITPDASFRRYYRINLPTTSYVLMDAPPPEKSCAAFVAIANCLRVHGLNAPAIFNADIEHGFLLLSDLGDTTYLKALNAANADHLYTQALDALHVMAQIEMNLAPFDAQFMQQEWAWHQEWFLQKYLNLHADLDQCMQIIISNVTEQPQVFMHRDYHSANIMVLADAPGILDFQDAFRGPLTYDLVSLLRDCYIAWPSEKVDAWVRYYWQKAAHEVDEKTFMRWFDMMGLQRHLKALLTFARKSVRDQQSSYLIHVPRTLKYILDVSAKYAELKPLHQFYKDKVLPLCVR